MKRKQKMSDRVYDGWHLIGAMLLGMVVIYYLLVNAPILMSVGARLAGCRGIEEYFTNTSFVDDVQEMREVYLENYAYEQTEDPFAQSPLYLKEGANIDCEDFANAVQCLGEEYGINCNIFFEFTAGSEQNRQTYTPTHAGVECFLNDKWRILG